MGLGVGDVLLEQWEDDRLFFIEVLANMIPKLSHEISDGSHGRGVRW